MLDRGKWSWMSVVGCALLVVLEQNTQARPVVGAAGRRSSSRHFVLVSATGQGTPVGAGVSASGNYRHVPGAGGQQP